MNTLRNCLFVIMAAALFAGLLSSTVSADRPNVTSECIKKSCDKAMKGKEYTDCMGACERRIPASNAGERDKCAKICREKMQTVYQGHLVKDCGADKSFAPLVIKCGK